MRVEEYHRRPYTRSSRSCSRRYSRYCDTSSWATVGKTCATTTLAGSRAVTWPIEFDRPTGIFRSHNRSLPRIQLDYDPFKNRNYQKLIFEHFKSFFFQRAQLT